MIRFVCIVLVIGLLAGSGWAQSCSSATTRGYYALVCTGSVSPAPNMPQVNFSAIGTVKIDYNGNATGTAKASIAGLIVDQVVTGVAVVNSDCTGTVVYDQKLNGQPAGKLNIVYHVLSDGQEIRGMSIDPGNTMVCNLRLISRMLP
ncbi:MAG TPA: hypothetical protein VML19_16100 [Verrucomicrobiae bacterium]|nr:hypothetical protein [Verrucomicrobiae bacterium]